MELYLETELRDAVSKLGEKIKALLCAQSSSPKNCRFDHFTLANLPRTGEKCTKMKTARDVQSDCFCLLKICKLFDFYLQPSRRRPFFLNLLNRPQG